MGIAVTPASNGLTLTTNLSAAEVAAGSEQLLELGASGAAALRLLERLSPVLGTLDEVAATLTIAVEHPGTPQARLQIQLFLDAPAQVERGTSAWWAHREEAARTIRFVTVVVDDYDKAIAWYKEKLSFEVVEDRKESQKRWVVISPSKSQGTSLVLGRASKAEQEARVGDQTGGRVFLFLNTDDIERDYLRMEAQGVHFEEQIRTEPYGKVAVFRDLYGNRWDLMELKAT